MLREAAREVLNRLSSLGKRKGPKMISRVWRLEGRKVRRGIMT